MLFRSYRGLNKRTLFKKEFQMEILIALVVIGLGLAFYYNRQAKNKVSSSNVPYKVESPTPAPVVEEVAPVVEEEADAE